MSINTIFSGTPTIGRTKGSEKIFSQVLYYSEEDIAIRERGVSKTERPPISKSITNGNRVTISQVWNNISSTYIQ